MTLPHNSVATHFLIHTDMLIIKNTLENNQINNAYVEKCFVF